MSADFRLEEPAHDHARPHRDDPVRDVEQALKSLARYYRLANDAIRLKLTRTAGGGVFEADVHGIPVQTARQNVEFGFAVIILVSLVTPAPSAKVQQLVEHVRYPNLKNT